MTTLGTHAEDKQANKQQQTQRRNNDNVGYTRGRQTNKQQQTQHRDNDNFGYTRGRQTNKQTTTNTTQRK